MWRLNASRRVISLLNCATILAGLLTGFSAAVGQPIHIPATSVAQQATVVTPSVPTLTPTEIPPLLLERRKQEWRRTVVAQPAPRHGCFKVSYPDTIWKATPCTPTRHIPFGRHVGGKPYLVGNGATSDFSAQVTAGTIALAVGSFGSISGGISENGTDVNSGSMGPNVYSLQMNSNTFTTKLCAGALAGAPCAGWEQFVYSDQGSTAQLLIQYWLLAYNTKCPGNWIAQNTTLSDGSTEIDCFMDADIGGSADSSQPGSGVDAPPIGVANLGQVSLAASGAPSHDSAVLLVGTDAYIVSGTDPLGLEQGWRSAEYNIFGDGSLSQATFGPNSTIAVNTSVQSGSPLQTPQCLQASYTGETNNLSLSGIPKVSSTESLPSIAFVESNSTAIAAGCAVSAAGGQGTLQWVSGEQFVDWAKDGTGLRHYTVGCAMCVVHAPSCGVVGHNGKDHFFPKDALLPAGVTVVGVAYMPFWPPNIHKTDRGSLGSAGSYGLDADPQVKQSQPQFSVHWQNACQGTASGDYTGNWSNLNTTYQVSFLLSVPNGTYVEGAQPFTNILGPICADADKPPAGIAPTSNTYPQSGTYPVALRKQAPSNGGWLPWLGTFPPPGVFGLIPINSWSVQSVYNPNNFDVFLVGIGHTSAECFQSGAGQLVKSSQSLTNLTALYGSANPPLYLVACTTGTLPQGVTMTVNYTY